jgi:hypothetical protein
MIDAVRVDAAEVRAKMRSSTPPYLVLAYEDDGAFRRFGLEGATPFSTLRALLPGLSKEREIILYCA